MHSETVNLADIDAETAKFLRGVAAEEMRSMLDGAGAGEDDDSAAAFLDKLIDDLRPLQSLFLAAEVGQWPSCVRTVARLRDLLSRNRAGEAEATDEDRAAELLIARGVAGFGDAESMREQAMRGTEKQRRLDAIIAQLQAHHLTMRDPEIATAVAA